MDVLSPTPTHSYAYDYWKIQMYIGIMHAAVLYSKGQYGQKVLEAIESSTASHSLTFHFYAHVL